MANNCNYTLKAVSKNKESLERLIKIMNYKDNEYYINRCFTADADDIMPDGEYFYVFIRGDVAWSAARWFETVESTDKLLVVDYEKNEDGTKNFDKPIRGTAHYITLDILCKRLGIAVELWSEEPGIGFQEHYVVDSTGFIDVNDCVDWAIVYNDDYCVFLDSDEFYLINE